MFTLNVTLLACKYYKQATNGLSWVQLLLNESNRLHSCITHTVITSSCNHEHVSVTTFIMHGSTCVKHSDQMKVISLRKAFILYLSHKAALLCSPQVQQLVFCAAFVPLQKLWSVYSHFSWQIVTMVFSVSWSYYWLFLCCVSQSSDFVWHSLAYYIITIYSFRNSLQLLHLYIYSFIILSSTFVMSKHGTSNIVVSWMPLFIYFLIQMTKIPLLEHFMMKITVNREKDHIYFTFQYWMSIILSFFQKPPLHLW